MSAKAHWLEKFVTKVATSDPLLAAALLCTTQAVFRPAIIMMDRTEPLNTRVYAAAREAATEATALVVCLLFARVVGVNLLSKHFFSGKGKALHALFKDLRKTLGKESFNKALEGNTSLKQLLKDTSLSDKAKTVLSKHADAIKGHGTDLLEQPLKALNGTMLLATRPIEHAFSTLGLFAANFVVPMATTVVTDFALKLFSGGKDTPTASTTSRPLKSGFRLNTTSISPAYSIQRSPWPKVRSVGMPYYAPPQYNPPSANVVGGPSVW